MTKIAIIGAGIAGLSCARRLADAGLKSVIFDKGRGIGGRVATRRARNDKLDDLRFDHGAPCAHAREAGFTAILRNLVDTGHAAPWTDCTGRTWTVGTPGMSAIPKELAAGLNVRLGTQITAVVSNGAGWRLHCDDTAYDASHVVITVPAPQISGILGAEHPLVSVIADVQMLPNLTLMATVSGDAPVVNDPMQSEPLALITQESSKPDRPQNDGTAWVAQAGQAFSLKYLEKEKSDIAKRMIPLLCNRLNITPDRVTHAVAHRWRYSQVSHSLGQPFARTSDGTLYLGGDWCIGPMVEDAWTSGTSIAADLLALGFDE